MPSSCIETTTDVLLKSCGAEGGDSEALYLMRGFVCHTRSSNHTHETDQINQMNQISATCREMVPGAVCSVDQEW
jgi:hypothetical protein